MTQLPTNPVINPQDRIKQRSDGRKAARTACSLVDISDMPEQIKIGFWLEMIRMMPDELKNQVG